MFLTGLTGPGDPVPAKGVNFRGEWLPGKKDAAGKDVPISHPNARCTIICDAIDNYNPAAAEDPNGVHVQVVTSSGRDADTMPPVWVAKSMDEGVAIGASIVSAATATEVGAGGGEGKKLLGEKKDVKVWLGWLELRPNGEVEAIETPIGFISLYEDLKKLFDGISKPYPKDLYDKQFSFYPDNIISILDLQDDAFRKDERVPVKIFAIYAAQKAGLVALKAKYGSVVSVEQLAEAAK